jgi:hypothetical protein
MQTAVWLFEGLRAAGIRLDDTHANNDEVQFPAETLGFKTGNARDLGLLYAAALEAAGIPAVIIPLNDDFIVACNLGVSQAGAELLFNSLEKILVIDDQVWLPLSMNAFNGGFMAAWDGGAEVLNAVFTEGGEANFIVLESAWGTYPPAPLPAQGGIRAGGGELASIADSVRRQYIIREIQPQAEAVQRQIAASPAAEGLSLARLYNRLAILLVYSGRIAEAKAAYERAAAMGLVPAMTNRGNLALIEKDYATAERWFTQALAREPENEAALRGLEKIGEQKE